MTSATTQLNGTRLIFFSEKVSAWEEEWKQT